MNLTRLEEKQSHLKRMSGCEDIGTLSGNNQIDCDSKGYRQELSIKLLRKVRELLLHLHHLEKRKRKSKMFL